MLNTADSLLSAMLEIHIERISTNFREFAVGEFEIPDDLVSYLDIAHFSHNGLVVDPRSRVQVWRQSQHSCVLRVPPAGDSGSIFLINPEHPDFQQIKVLQETAIMAAVGNSGALEARVLGDIVVPQNARLSDFTWHGLVDVNGLPLSSAAQKKVTVEIKELGTEILAYLHDRPELLRELTPRAFEEAMAAFYAARKWQVQLTPASRDGGKDLIIVKSDEAGLRMCYVECKRYEAHLPVKVGVIRQLYGVVEAARATSGIVATTSFFTKGAETEARSFGHRMALHDFEALSAMLRSQSI